MSIQEFLDQIRFLFLEDNEKENQLLSQRKNSKRSSKLGGCKSPFAEQTIKQKSKKKITFLMVEDTRDKESTEMGDSIGVAPSPQKSKKSQQSPRTAMSSSGVSRKCGKQQLIIDKVIFP